MQKYKKNKIIHTESFLFFQMIFKDISWIRIASYVTEGK
jgi:hypothetical protein